MITFFSPCYAQDISLDSLLNSINTKGYISKTETNKTNKVNDFISIPSIPNKEEQKEPKYIDTTDDHNGHYVRDESDLYDADNIRVPMGYERYKIPISKNIQIVLFTFKPKDTFKKSYEKFFNPNYVSQQIPLPNLSVDKILDYFTFRGDVKLLDDYTNLFYYDKDLSIRLKNLKGDFKVIESSKPGISKILFNIHQNGDIKGILLTKDNAVVMTPIITGDVNLLLMLRVF
jgi:hypothetical protein